MTNSPDQVLPFDNSYARLPERFYERRRLTPVAAPRLVELNAALAKQLGLDAAWLAGTDGVAMLAGNCMPAGATPIAQAYAGHQFGHFQPQLGDGRAMLLGEVVATDGRRYDIQLKGSGPSRFSRRGDGRAALGPVLREYIVSEAFAALGIPSTRALAVVTTGETVVRETALPGSILTRVASSHVRVGTFQYFAARRDIEALRLLADHVIERHYPEASQESNPYAALIGAVAVRQGRLIAEWLLVGFIHGVMNTDNMSIAGETIDFGPCAFMDAFDPGAVFSSIDHGGRYGYSNQPRIAQWNLARFAETLLPLIDDDEDAAVTIATSAVETFAPAFQAAYAAGLGRKLGFSEHRAGDLELAQSLLEQMATSRADFTLTFRELSEAFGGDIELPKVRQRFADRVKFDEWRTLWRDRLERQQGGAPLARQFMRMANPAFIPRNHVIERVIRAAVDDGDFSEFRQLNAVLRHPFDDQPNSAGAFGQPPAEHEIVRQTFCGT